MREPTAVVRRPARTPEDSATAANRRRRWLPITFGLGVVITFLLTFTTWGATNDTESAAVAAWRIAATGTPWLEGVDLDALPHISADKLWTTTAVDGHTTISRSPGVVAVAVPAYFVFGADDDPAHFSPVPGALTAALMTSAGVLLLLASLRGLLSSVRRHAVIAVVAFGTPIWTVAADDLYTHSITVPGIAGMAWAVRRERWWLAGAFGGVALWGRLHAVLIVAILGLGIAVWRRRPRIAVEMGLVSGLFLGLASLWSKAIYGHLSPTGGYGPPSQYAEHAAHTGRLHQVVNELGLLVAPDRGLLVWTPLLVLLLPAVIRGWRQAPDWTKVLAVAGIAYMGAQGLLNEFPGGDGFFGYRLTIETLVCLVPLYAVSTTAMGRWGRTLVGPVAGLQVGAMAIGAATHLWQLPLSESWRDNALWLALRTDPRLWWLLALTALVGTLGGIVWRERRL